MDVGLLTYSTRPRGGVVHTLALAEAMAAAGARVTVYGVAPAPGEGFFRAIDPRVNVCLAERTATAADDVEGRVLASIDALARCVKPASHEVVHAQDCISANAVPGSVRTVHHLDQFTSPVLAACHERGIIEPAAHVCVSAGVAAELRAGWGVHSTVIPNGVDAARFARAAAPDTAFARSSWRERLGGDPLLLTIGGIEPRKGTMQLVEAVALVRERRPDVRLVIAGGETLFDYRSYRRAVEDRCHELDLQPIVLGAVDDDAIPALLACADVFLLPSVKEGFGLAAMEALAAERPLVLSDLPVFREVFAGVARFGEDPAGLAEAVLDLLAHPPDPSPGAELAARYTWKAAAEGHLALYAALARYPTSLGRN